jgi:cytochrome c-type biogenesis protein CcmH/NrfF
MKIVSNRWRRTGAGLVLVWGLLAAGSALAEEPGFEPEGWAYKMAAELLSPFCPGRTLAECPSPNAESLRLWIITQEAAGRSRADVEEELYARYGDDIRSAPRAEGFGLTAYVLPILAFVAGGGFLAWFLKRQTGGHADDPPPPAVADLDPELLRQVDEELGG